MAKKKSNPLKRHQANNRNRKSKSFPLSFDRIALNLVNALVFAPLVASLSSKKEEALPETIDIDCEVVNDQKQLKP